MSLSEKVLAPSRRSQPLPASIIWWERANSRLVLTLVMMLATIIIWVCVERTLGITAVGNLMVCVPSGAMAVMTGIAYTKHFRAYRRGD